MAQNYQVQVTKEAVSFAERGSGIRQSPDPRELLTQIMTIRAAVMEISSPSFPQIADLPRMAALPFVNAGHVILLDYHLLCDLLWSAALSLKEVIMKAKTTHKRRTIVAAALSCMLVLIAAFIDPGAAILIGIVGAVATAIVHGLPADCTAEIDARRKRIVDELARTGTIAGQAELLPTPERLQWGTGAINPQWAPVLVAADQRKFPGYGREKISQLFVCPLKELQRPADIDENTLRHNIQQAAVQAIQGAGVDNVYTGPVLVIGSDIPIDSPWLDRQKRPLLWVQSGELSGMIASDPRVSVRSYVAFQIVFPSHWTAATFFLRTFKCGSAANVELVLSTLGPVVYDATFVAHRSAQLGFVTQDTAPKADKDDSRYTKALKRYSHYDKSRRFHAQLWPDLEKLTPNPAEEQQRLQQEAERVQGLRPYWIGNWPGLPDWRETHSLAFTNDYFGQVEARAAVRAVYEVLVGKVLDELDSKGFDVRSYRDHDGKLTIHADKIDNVVVGERVFMQDAPANNNQGDTNSGTTAKGTGTNG